MGQHLIAMRRNTINAFSPPTKSRIHVEDLPVGVTCDAAIVLPNGVLFMIGIDAEEKHSKHNYECDVVFFTYKVCPGSSVVF